MTSYSLDSNAYPIITPTSGSWSAWAEYRQRSSDSTHVYYDLWNTVSGGFQSTTQENLNNSGGYQIRVESSTDIWSDYPGGGHTPTFQGNVNGVITLGSGSGDFVFTKPSGTGQTPWSSGGSGGGFLSNNPKIENITFTKTSDVSFNLSFDWENLSSYTVTNSRNGVLQTASANLSGSSGSENGPISLSCQDGDLLWVHGDNTYHPLGLGSQGHPYVFRFVNFSIAGTTLTMSTFFHGSTGLNNDADFRVWDPDAQSWDRLGYVNYDGNLQTQTVTPFERGKEYYIVDRSTGNDYGTRYVAPGTGRRCRGRTFW